LSTGKGEGQRGKGKKFRIADCGLGIGNCGLRIADWGFCFGLGMGMADWIGDVTESCRHVQKSVHRSPVLVSVGAAFQRGQSVRISGFEVWQIGVDGVIASRETTSQSDYQNQLQQGMTTKSVI